MVRAEHRPDDRSRYGHAHSDGAPGRVHARPGGGVELQRVDVLQRVRPGANASAGSCGSATAPTRATPSSRRASTFPTAGSRSRTTGPKISNNDAFDAGGTRFEVVTPFEELRTTYDGKLAMLTEPLQMANPRQAFTENPWVEAHVELTHRGVSPMYGGEPVNDDGSPLAKDHSGGFARGHYEQHMAVEGTIRVGDDEWPVNGFGLRDHSWGPRFWQAPWWYRWLTANFGADFGFVVSIIASRDGGRRYGGIVLRDGVYEHIQPRDDRDGLDRRRPVPRRGARRPRRPTPTPTRSPAASSTSSRCATGARRPRASSSSRASPRA